MNSKVAKIFQNSQNISCILLISLFCLVEKDKSHKLIRKAIINDKREANQLKKEELKDTTSLTPGLKNEIDRLMEELEVKNDKKEVYEKQEKMLETLFDFGIIDGNGNLIKKRENDNMNDIFFNII